MKKLKMIPNQKLTFEEGCNKYLEYCRQRNLRQDTIRQHTFAKQWILNGGNVVALSKLLGHSSLDITQNYINLLVSDVAKEVQEINVLDKFYSKQRITIKK